MAPHDHAQHAPRTRVPSAAGGGAPRGGGADSLAAEAARAEFVLLGEEHGTAEVPRFAAARLRRIRPAGYRHLALEVGPFDDALLAELAELQGAISFHVGFFSLDPDGPLLPALRAVPDGAWAVLDLRPLRRVLNRAERDGARTDPGLVSLARRYDAMILAPRLTRSALLPPE